MGFFSNFTNNCPNHCKDQEGTSVKMVDVEWYEGYTKFVCPICGREEWR